MEKGAHAVAVDYPDFVQKAGALLPA